MNLKEAANFLGTTAEETRRFVETGIYSHFKQQQIFLSAAATDGDYAIDETSIDQFTDSFEPGDARKRPPVDTQRKLWYESGGRCQACGDGGLLDFHHMVEWNDLRHNDPAFMLALCGSCHDMAHRGLLDKGTQRYCKDCALKGMRPGRAFVEAATDPNPIVFTWTDVHDILTVLSPYISTANGLPTVNFDLLQLESKNLLNNLRPTYFEFMRSSHELYFGRIQEFLESAANEMQRQIYLDFCSEIQVALTRQDLSKCHFDDFLQQIYGELVREHQWELRGKKSLLLVLLSFMYFQCDIGRKDVATD